MSNYGVSPIVDDDATRRFPSLASLRAAHSELLKRHRQFGTKPELWTEIEDFIKRGRATGALLDNDEDRWAGQSLLDYWTSVSYRAGYEPPDATLAKFDPSLAPELNDSLCPYLGLEAFQESKHNLFYGRQRLLEQLVNKLKDSRLLTVVGSSGSGKSSVVLAGLLPSLKAGTLPGSKNWRYYPPVVPGGDPLATLARCLQPSNVNAAEWIQKQIEGFQRSPNHLAQIINDSGSSPAVLVVDQFEEVFTLCNSDEVRQAFINNLIGLIQSPGARHTVILTMRADFESQVVRVANFNSLFQQAQVRVTAMDASELREAIEKPADLVGLKFEAPLVDFLLKDVLGEVAALPLLQFTLLKLWDERERNWVTWAAYKRLGGGRRALANSADEFYHELIPEDQIAAKRILLKMVRPTEGLEVTSNRIQLKTIYQTGEARDRIERVLNRLIEARLVRLTGGNIQDDDAQVEVAHEALVRNWPQLVEWLDEERVTMRQRIRLMAAAKEWEAQGKHESTLWRGVLLNEAQRYKDLDGLEAEFVKHSIKAEEKEKQRQLETSQTLANESEARRQAEAKARQEAEQRAQESEARRQAEAEARKQAEQRVEQERKALRAAQKLNRVTIISLIGLIGLASVILYQWHVAHKTTINALAQTSEAFLLSHKQLEALDKTVQAGRGLENPILFQDAAVRQTVSAALQQAVYNVQERNRLEGNSGAVYSVSVSPDGKTLASAGANDTVDLWDAATGKKITTLEGHRKLVTDVSFSPDSKTLASASWDKTVKLWDVATGKPIKTFSGHSAEVTGVSFSPDGKTLASASADNTVKLWDVAKGTVKIFRGHSEGVTKVSFSPDGKRLASAGLDNTVKLWDVAKGTVKTFRGHSAPVYSVSFSPDGKTLASAGVDKTVKLWDVAKGTVKTFRGHSAPVYSVSFSPDGKTLASASSDTTIKIWDVATGTEIDTLYGHSAPVYSVSFSPDGKTLASASWDTTVKLWDIETGKAIKTFTGYFDEVKDVSFSPDGKTLASASADNTVKLWNVATGTVKPFTGHSISFSPDGTRLASASADKTVKLWDVATGKAIKTFTRYSDVITDVSFSPDGKTLASASADKTIKLWNVDTGTEIKTFRGHSKGVYSVSFSPDGKTLASASADNTVKLWDVATGKAIKTFTGHSNGVNAVSFSPDGKTLASASADKTVKLWELYSNNLNNLMTRSCDWIRDYLHTNPYVSDRKLCDGIGTQSQPH